MNITGYGATRLAWIAGAMLLLCACSMDSGRHCERADIAAVCTALTTQAEVRAFVYPDPAAAVPDAQALESFTDKVAEVAGQARVLEISAPTGRVLVRLDKATLARLATLEGARFALDQFHEFVPLTATPEENRRDPSISGIEPTPPLE